MKIGTYFAYWAKEWKVNYLDYVKKAADAGFDVLEISSGITNLSDGELITLRDAARDAGLIMTACLGIPADLDVSNEDPAVRRAGINYMKEMFIAMDKCDIRKIGGILYAYWPCDYSKPVNKAAARARSIESVREMADFAAGYGIEMEMEIVNRFEQYLLNDSREALAYAEDVGRDNVKIMLDSFHMNIEEDSFREAILRCEGRLGHFHIGEANRKCPNADGRMPWEEMAQALRDIHYDGYVVMEPFVRMGGGVGSDIKVWRDISSGASDEQIDADIKASCAFCKKVFHD